MSITLYKTVFSEYHHGPTSFVHMLSEPIAANRDPAIHQEDVDKLKDAMANAIKKIDTKLVFYGSHANDKVMQLNHLAYHTKRSVCFIDCQRLVDKFIGETEKNIAKLLAQAESKNWILFFDEADALFDPRSKVKVEQNEYANQEVSYLFKLLSQYPGLSILSMTEKSKLERIEYLVDSVIYFR